MEATKCVIPMACLYSPLKTIYGMPPALPYQPVRCRQPNCGAILNPYCQIDFRAKLWTCPFCGQRNHFPPEYAQNISESSLPYEVMPAYTTVEYEIQGRQSIPPVFLLVIDTTIDAKELNSLKDTLQQNLSFLPDNALVGIVSYGMHVEVHELTTSDISRSYVFNGKKEYATSKVADMLGLRGTVAQTQIGASSAASRFIMPIGDCSVMIDTILSELEKDPWPVAAQHRAERSTGSALSIASSLLEIACPQSPAHIMLFAGGPCTSGPGMIVGTDLEETIRAHVDIERDKAPHLKAATTFYEGLAERCRKSRQTIDLFACCLDQVGLLEMRSCIETTGGLCMLGDFFSQSIFQQSLAHVFEVYPEDYRQGDADNLMMGFGATIELQTTKEFKVSGCIGPCVSQKKAGPSVGELEIGECGTTSWYLGCIDPSTTLAFYFEVSNSEDTSIQNRRRCLQLVTSYTHPNGRLRLRVTTVSGAWHMDFNNMGPVAASFDQECAAVVMARLATTRLLEEPVSDVLRWIDRSLIRLCAKFADYRPDDASSFRLSNEFAIFPQFMFHLRRSQFMQHINYSPDESCYHRMMLCRQPLTNCLVMIQPALISYSFNSPPQPVLLDATSVKPDVMLLMDTFFTLVVFHGATIAAWRDAGYQNQPEYANFKQLLEQPLDDAQNIIADRFPVPRYILCDEGKSQSRFLMAKVNPSVTQNSYDSTCAPVLTDDVSLKVFLDHLMKLAVQS
ncbi:hypothetical protein WA556_005168 [Blastocystis sp. ATCC 50177/Nand II]